MIKLFSRLFPLLLVFGGGSDAFRRTQQIQLLPLPAVRDPSGEQWFDQALDHFDATNTATWRQRYWTNFDHYVAGGPAMIYIGGEAEANPKWMTFGAWYEYAQETGAAMFLLEHRYYGDSRPTADMSTPNMKYLSSRQALEDLAGFMTAMSAEHSLTGPWVSFGGSYPGSLSAWLRLKFPHLLAGAVSSSGPLHAKLDYHEYLEVVAAALDTTGPECNAAITEALAAIDLMMLEGEEAGLAELSTLFSTCSPIDGSVEADLLNFVELLIDNNLAAVVQYNGRVGRPIDITAVCGWMTDTSLGSPLERFAVLNDQVMEFNGAACLDHEYASFLGQIQAEGWSGSGFDWRPWLWQTCTEFGWYQTTNQESGVYGRKLPLEFFETWCQDAFGADFTHERLETEMVATNAEYGGFNINVENVVFVHGSIDPWHAMGVLEDVNEWAPAIYITGTSHCNDMYPNFPGDSEELLAAREKIGGLVKTWVTGGHGYQ